MYIVILFTDALDYFTEHLVPTKKRMERLAPGRKGKRAKAEIVEWLLMWVDWLVGFTAIDNDDSEGFWYKFSDLAIQRLEDADLPYRIVD